ncbi:MAG: Uma2 family endonuclease, partial [Glycomyces artemisiae]|nr:Uma2 family endonuclease [Glycomyces artemisiae]
DILLPQPPRDSGWESDDLDHPGLPDHVELIYGALSLMMSRQRAWHQQMICQIARAFEAATHSGWQFLTRMTFRIDERNRPEPDLLLVADRPYYDLSTTWYRPEDIALVGEVEAPETEARDRELKPMLYAKAGVPQYLRVAEDTDGTPVLYRYRLVKGEYELVHVQYGRVVLDEPVKVDTKLEGNW